ncbi:MAG: sulfatase-like hydrolase/transferase, partial [Lachnospiraceae bacterium]|nr:sulfatase-like hydrolase/transferase [Lachnospiraceae bacterium]
IIIMGIVNVLTALILSFYLELMERKSLSLVWQFIHQRTFVFLYGCLIIFVSLQVLMLTRRRLFMYIFVTGVWASIGTINGMVLNSRKTPFAAVDLTIAKSILPVLPSYLATWQIVLIIAVIFILVILFVCLFLYLPPTRKKIPYKVNAAVVTVILAVFSMITYFGVGQGRLIRRFDNLINGYQDYGVVYGFCVTALDTGIDRPINYSRRNVKKILKEVNSEMKKKDAFFQGEKRRPNVIFIQLESFYDPTQMKNLQFSEDPIPYFHKIQKQYTSGRLTVPVYGAGTINTEFEVITGMNVHHFGTGEYPYRSVLEKKQCDSMARWMREEGYESSVIHNNNSSFYDRNIVLANLGFQNFISSENMNIESHNAAGWAKDQVLEGYIMDTLRTTSKKDLIYAISVQGHGDYPTSPQTEGSIRVSGAGYQEGYLNQMTYYANQIHEMDDFIKNLLGKLSRFKEDTVVVAYGDHLPGLGIETKDLKKGTRFQTPYFIWDNFGLSRSLKEKDSGNIHAYQLASKVFEQIHMTRGTINRFHQAEDGHKKAQEKTQKRLKLLEYDMLYGANFAWAGKEPLEPTEIRFAVNLPEIREVREDQGYYYLIGSGFTDNSRVSERGIHLTTQKISDTVLKITDGSLHDGASLVVNQVSSTNDKIILDSSKEFIYHKDSLLPMYPKMEEEEEEQP